MGTVRIPADVEQPDRILGGMTARQLIAGACAGVLCWAVYSAVHAIAPFPVAAAVTVPFGLAGAFVVFGRRDGLSGDRLLLAMWRFRRSSRRAVLAPEGVPPVPDWVAGFEPSPQPLQFPVTGVDGAVTDLADGGCALVCKTSSLNFSLRSAREQDALVAGFGRLLNGLSAGLQIVVRTERADVSDLVAGLQDAARSLPHPALESAACEHGEFLTSLAARRDVVRREVLVVLREDQPRDVATTVLLRRAEDVISALSALGLTASILTGDEVHTLLRKITGQPGSPAPAGTSGDGVVTGGLQ